MGVSLNEPGWGGQPLTSASIALKSDLQAKKRLNAGPCIPCESADPRAPPCLVLPLKPLDFITRLAQIRKKPNDDKTKKISPFLFPCAAQKQTFFFPLLPPELHYVNTPLAIVSLPQVSGPIVGGDARSSRPGLRRRGRRSRGLLLVVELGNGQKPKLHPSMHRCRWQPCACRVPRSLVGSLTRPEWRTPPLGW